MNCKSTYTLERKELTPYIVIYLTTISIKIRKNCNWKKKKTIWFTRRKVVDRIKPRNFDTKNKVNMGW